MTPAPAQLIDRRRRYDAMAVKTLQLRRPDTCAACRRALVVGTKAQWDGALKTVTCLSCADAPPAVDPGESGRSAAREYERRSRRELARKQQVVAQDAAWREQVKTDHPILGRVATMVTPRPVIGSESQATRAWKQGAEGEERVGQILDSCSGVRALHDRRVPGSKANIDHLAVGPSGIYVIDAKRYEGEVEVRDKGSWLRPDRRLYVNGRDRSKLVEGVLWQAQSVRRALGDEHADVEIRAVLCFVDAQWPIVFRRPLVVDAVTALWPDALAGNVSVAGALSEEQVERVTRTLATALKPA